MSLRGRNSRSWASLQVVDYVPETDLRKLLLAMTMGCVFLAGCASAARPAGIEAESKLEAQAENQHYLQCESGKEHWRDRKSVV